MRTLVLAVLSFLAIASPVLASPLGDATVAVQAVVPMPDGRARVSECTGALIALDLVLTAGHCLDGVERPAHVAVFAYDGAAPKPPHLAVLRFARHPGHVAGWREKAGDPSTRSREIAADLALLRLARPAPNGAPVALGPTPDDATAGRATLGGVGRSGPGPTGKSGAKKVMTASSVRFSTGVAGRVAFASPDRPTCTGDSGGPVGSADGSRVWGVVSAILKPRDGCGSRIVVAPVDPASPGFVAMRRALD